MIIQDLKFSHNWNTLNRKGIETGKLDCRCFTSLRLDTDKYVVGRVYRVLIEKKTGNKVYGYARLQLKFSFQRDNLSDGIAFIDTGYNAVECLTILKRMYPNSVPKTPMVCCFFRYLTDAEIKKLETEMQTKLVLSNA